MSINKLERNALFTPNVSSKITRRYFNEKDFKQGKEEKDDDPETIERKKEIRKKGTWILDNLKRIFKLALILLAEYDEGSLINTVQNVFLYLFVCLCVCVTVDDSS